MTKRLIPFIIGLALLFISLRGASHGLDLGQSSPMDQSNYQEKKVIMLIINRIDFEDLDQMPKLKSLIGRSGIGLMNTRASGKNSEYKSYASIGWGTRAEASHNSSLFHKLDSHTRPIYRRRTGKEPPGDGLINLDINSLIVQNERGDYGAIPGLLGQILNDNGHRTALLGNGNLDDSQITPAGLIGMDLDGYINFGHIGKDLLEEDEGRPFGLKTNYKLLFEKFQEEYRRADLLVIETGDSIRLERYRDKLNFQAYQEQKSNILGEIDDFVLNIVESMGREDRLIITVPYPSDLAASRGERLTPLIIYEGKYGGEDRGGQLLYSQTTRRQGLVANLDIGPTILAYFNLTSDKMTGRPIQALDQEDNLAYVNKLNKTIVNTSNQRYRVLYSFAIYEILVSLLALVLISLKWDILIGWHKYISLGLIANMLIPFSLLILPLFGVKNIVATYLLLIVITAGLLGLLNYLTRGNNLGMVLYSSGLLALGLIIDIASGQNLIKNSLLGYDPIIGARYYGLGNEYMGILIGAVLIFTTTAMEKYRIGRSLLVLFYGLAVLVIGFPKLGANVGGTITGLFAFLFVIIKLSGQKITPRKFIYMGLAVVASIALLALADLFIIESKSHLAAAIEQIIARGPITIYQIISRKIAMNIKIMGVTIWSKVLLSGILVLAILFYRPIGWIKKISGKYNYLAIGWTGIIIACIVGFTVNDSGIVAAATSIIFLTSTILYLIIEELGY